MRSVLVTGASKGIGRAIALQLAADGFTVGVHYHRDEAGAQETLEAIVQTGGAGRLLTFDVGNREQCRTVLEQASLTTARGMAWSVTPVLPATAHFRRSATMTGTA